MKKLFIFTTLAITGLLINQATIAAIIPLMPNNKQILQKAMEAVNALPTTPECKAAIIMINPNAGGAGCTAEWAKGRGSWWKEISIGKDGTSFNERLNFLKEKGLPIPKHEITQDTWRTPAEGSVNINGVNAGKAWTYCN